MGWTFDRQRQWEGKKERAKKVHTLLCDCVHERPEFLCKAGYVQGGSLL